MTLQRVANPWQSMLHFPRYIAFYVCFLSLALVMADSVSVKKAYADYSSIAAACGPGVDVCDPNGLLAREERNVLRQAEVSLLRGDSCRGFDVSAVILQRMPDDGRSLADRAAYLAKRLLEERALTSKCKNEVLFLFAMGDRRVYIATGLSAQRSLDNNAVRTVIDKMIPYLSQNDAYRALLVGIQAVAQYLPERHDTPESIGGGPGSHETSSRRRSTQGPAGWWGWGLTFTSIVMGLCLIIACLNGVGGSKRSKLRDILSPNHCALCLERLAKLNTTEEAARSSDFTVIESARIKTQPALGNKTPDITTNALLSEDKCNLSCGHVFHTSCLNDWKQRSGNQQCPLCRVGDGATTLTEVERAERNFRVERAMIIHPELSDVISCQTVQSSHWQPATLQQYAMSPPRSSIPGVGWMMGLGAAGAAAGAALTSAWTSGREDGYGTARSNDFADGALGSSGGGAGQGWGGLGNSSEGAGLEWNSNMFSDNSGGGGGRGWTGTGDDGGGSGRGW